MNSKFNLLVVDDDPFSLDSADSILRGFGYSVRACRSADEALSILARSPIDVVLTDVRMPGLSGIELLEEIRRRSPDLPVILMTAYAELDTAVEAIEKGAFDLIIKPYKPLQLFHSLSKAIHVLELKTHIDEQNLTAENLRKTQEKLVQAYAELKTLHEQMLQSEKMASIGQLAAGVAHEINNPIGFITSNLNTLKKYVERLIGFIDAQSEAIRMIPPESGAGPELPELRRSLKIAHILKDAPTLIDESLDGADRVRVIVQNLKSFSRSGGDECESEDLTRCLESAISLVWNELRYKAALRREYGDIPLTKCYPRQLGQVFMNLLVNAAHAIDERGEITIRTWHERGSIFVSITDTGCGIPKENLDRIFEPFFTTKEPGKGTGLGLSIVLDIIRKHNGEISAESEAGKGTSFIVRIPVMAG